MDQDDLSTRWQSDPAAFERLVGRWQARVARFIARLLGDRESIQDLCQEVFLRVYLARARYRADAAFSTWLFQIALNVARDALRRRRPVAGLLDIEPEDDAPSAGTAFEQEELVRALEEALAGLPQALREVLVLRHYENMNFEEIGRLLKVPASTLKSRFAVALSRLRRHLKQLGYHEETC